MSGGAGSWWRRWEGCGRVREGERCSVIAPVMVTVFVLSFCFIRHFSDIRWARCLGVGLVLGGLGGGDGGDEG